MPQAAHVDQSEAALLPEKTFNLASQNRPPTHLSSTAINLSFTVMVTCYIKHNPLPFHNASSNLRASLTLAGVNDAGAQ